MRVCNFLVTRRFPGSSLNFAISLLLRRSLVGKDRTKFASCMKKVCVLADIFQDSIRARDTLRHLARSLPTLLLSHGFKTIQTRCNRLLKGDLEWGFGRLVLRQGAPGRHVWQLIPTQERLAPPLNLTLWYRNWPGQAIFPSLVRQCVRIQHHRWVLTLL